MNGTAWYYSQVRCDPSDPEHVISLNAHVARIVRRRQDAGRRSRRGTACTATTTRSGSIRRRPGADDPRHRRRPQHRRGIAAARGATSRTSSRRSSTRSRWTTRSRSTTCTADCRTTSSGAARAARATRSARRTPTGSACTAATASTRCPIRGTTTSSTPRCRAAAWCATTSARARRRTSSRCRRTSEKHRFNWSAPILPSRHDPKTVYMAANYLFRSPDRGDSWVTISPDLTRGIDRNKLPMRGERSGLDGARPQRRHGGVQQHLDDRRVAAEGGAARGRHRRRPDPGHARRRQDVDEDRAFPGRAGHDVREPRRVLEGGEGTIYATLDGHRSNDFKPYVLKSTDLRHRRGRRSRRNLPGRRQRAGDPRASAADRTCCSSGTEFGVYFTIDGGGHWTQLEERNSGRARARHPDPGALERPRRRHARSRHLHPRRPRAARASRAGEAGAGRVHVPDSRRARSSSRTRRAARAWERADSPGRIPSSAPGSRTC